MKKLLLPLSLVVVAAASVLAVQACNPPPAEGEGEGEGEAAEGEGEVAEGEGDVAEGEGETTGGTLGDKCSSDANCATGFACGSFFADPAAAKACMPTCATAGEACTIVTGLDGTCQQVPNVSSTTCVHESVLLGLCGNGISSVCATGVACGLAGADNPNTPVDDSIVGLCIVPCDAADVCTDATLACSDDIQIQAAGGNVGVCVPPTNVGDACGGNADGSTTVCSGAQNCEVAAGAQTGTCVADAGGEGEGE